MATGSKHDGRWQAVIKHKDVGTTLRSFTSKSDTMEWSNEQEQQLENSNFDTLEPTGRHLT